MILLTAASCSPVVTAPGTVIEVSALPGWQADRVLEAVAAFVNSCGRPAPGLGPACAAARRSHPADEAAARRFVSSMFQAVSLGAVPVTGYYEPELRGSRTRQPGFPVPVLRPPSDPGRFSRSEILAGALAGQGLELVYLPSLADLYILQVQGSGRVMLLDGSILLLGHGGDNGRPSIPPGVLFAGAGVPRNDLAGAGIRAWVAARPREALVLLGRDPNYVFFREQRGAGAERPRGFDGAPLTPLRSIGVDRGFLALGTPAWLDVEAPGGRLSRMVVAQDTGEGVHGPHADVFFGSGAAAAQAGGRMAATGRLWRLVPRALSAPP